jgi:hypothetical protein
MPFPPGQGGGWGPQPRPPVRRLPGVGAIVAIVGLLVFILSLTAFPWVSGAGQDVTLLEIGDTFEDAGQVDDEYLYLEAYATWLWLGVAAYLALGVLFSTLVVPASYGLRIVLGFLLGGVVGLLVNAVDREGSVGPRVMGALVTLGVAGAHGFAVYKVFDGVDDPQYGWGIYAGFGGLLLVLVGCVIGTRADRLTPALAYATSYR